MILRYAKMVLLEMVQILHMLISGHRWLFWMDKSIEKNEVTLYFLDSYSYIYSIVSRHVCMATRDMLTLFSLMISAAELVKNPGMIVYWLNFLASKLSFFVRNSVWCNACAWCRNTDLREKLKPCIKSLEHLHGQHPIDTQGLSTCRFSCSTRKEATSGLLTSSVLCCHWVFELNRKFSICDGWWATEGMTYFVFCCWSSTCSCWVSWWLLSCGWKGKVFRSYQTLRAYELLEF